MFKNISFNINNMDDSDNNSIKKNICNFTSCNKKLKLSDYPCKCEKLFCKYHRDPKQHNCEYDFKENHLKNEKIENMKCIKDKVITI